MRIGRFTIPGCHPLLVGILVAIVVRCVLFYPGETGDTKRYLAQAESLAAGGGYGRDGVPDVRLPPGYPVFLASVRSLTESHAALRAIQVALSVLSCALVYQAVCLVNRKTAIVALLLMALAPALAHYAAYMLSEVLSVFLMSLLALFLGREQSAKGAASLNLTCIGLLCCALVLTAPATALLAAFLCGAVSIRHRFHLRSIGAVACGIALLMIPWQLHCVRAVGRPIPTVYDFSTFTVMNSGFGDWVRTWKIWPSEGRVYHFHKDVKFFDRAPSNAFASDEERRRLRGLCEDLNAERIDRGSFDAEFAAVATRRRHEAPLRAPVVLPLYRSVVLWTYLDNLWPAQPTYIGRLGYRTFVADQRDHGVQRALLRQGKAAYSVLLFLMTIGYTALFVWLSWRSIAGKRLIGIAIVCGVLAYTAAGAHTGAHEIRRNAVFFPVLLFLLAYVPRKNSPPAPAGDPTANTSSGHAAVPGNCGSQVGPGCSSSIGGTPSSSVELSGRAECHASVDQRVADRDRSEDSLPPLIQEPGPRITPATAGAPLVSIGMTVYNAAAFVRKTLDSLLAQDYPNLELVISDNASTDGSSEICQRFAERDPRVRYYRNSENIGAVRNWNRTLELARGELFMWASDHDLWDPTYVSKAYTTLAQEQDVVLVYPHGHLIDAKGRFLDKIDANLDTTGMPLKERFKRVLWQLRKCPMVHGLVRTATLKKLGGFPNVWAMDLALLAALSTYGEFHQLADVLYFRRENRPGARDNASEQTRAFQIAQLDPSRARERAGWSRRQRYRETRDALLRLLAEAPVGRIERLHLQAIAIACYRARHGVGFWGLERFTRLLPKRVRRGRILRPKDSETIALSRTQPRV